MPRVLVCDDYKYVRYLVAELLRSTGLKVVCAQTGHDALGSYLDLRSEPGRLVVWKGWNGQKETPAIAGVSFSFCRPELGRITVDGQIHSPFPMGSSTGRTLGQRGYGTNVEAVVAY